MKTFFHADQALHHPQTYFSRGKMRTPQEVPERAMHLLAAAKRLGFDIRSPADHGAGPIRAVHSLPYLRFLESAHRRWQAMGEDWGEEVISNIFVRSPNALRGILAEAARYLADGSAPVGQHTWHSAYWSAQSAVAGAKALLAGEPFAYALSRPPGHHASIDSAGGFCFLNNAAIAAQHLTSRFPRIVVLDPDMHHGQGIQNIFYQRDDVLYISIHGDTTNFYPGVSGFEEERGEGAGLGYNLNLPMPHGSKEAVFFERLADACQAIRLFEPDALVLALGFDIYERDPQAKVAVSTAGFAELGRRVAELNVPTLVVQEGGYYLEGLEANAVSFFEGLLMRR
ncbi:MAG: histone deacetylase family protein [Halomonas sp.]|jgi:acetoin utilization deacetylase AcuC-like enzyme|uniref:Acetoin utilization deacetylase AcuC n=1 Tax=Vreelandella aquamarina TaxID=77097 RepID=A0A1H8M7H5_9GAMM|nr:MULTISPECIES: histone deacetylase family protein [Halomonas]KTG22604.1 acetylpolyamine aminohydrolase [Idiomarina sp. H105]OAF13512.1 acetylpolyamine aminohydrolase [Idiomarina sp. WRN-38]MAM04260.1 histone deacetylase family protein [Halomonas sp.]MCO7242907.1 histone deacetylase family protein [Halomonas sp. Ps84H-12]MDK2750724.1 histone deacetylase family protein [Halomonas meridiana]|tara:strand:+ start:783 stop:1805 length:1023 start_codon:yes stop_codon:yes gene_type:complete